MGREGVLHVLTVSFLGQGHVNPLLRLSKRLASMGHWVTFSTTHNIGQMIQNATNTNTTTTTCIADGHLRFEFFSDGWGDDEPKRHDFDALLLQLETVGRDSLTRLINKQAEEGRPVSCIVNNPFLPWVSDLATELGIPCAVLWVQSCASYSAHYHYHYFHHLVNSFPTVEQPNLSLDLPGLPTLKSDEIPTLLHPSNLFLSIKDAVLKQIQNLSQSFCVLVDSFEELEREAIEPMAHLSPIRPVGPLFKNSDTSIRGDMWTAAEDCLVWLDSQPVASVVYVSFGSIVILEKNQMVEMAMGLLNSGSPFLWVIKPRPNDPVEILPEELLKEVEGKGMVVPWCPQEQVLAHPSVGCFVTHCGWNSTMESLASGVPVVTFPQWGDQVTNAKFLVDVYGVGVRMGRGIEDGKSLSRDVVERCVLEITRGPKAEEIKKNALKWKNAAEEAVAEGGSSNRNLQQFVDDIRRIALENL